MKWLLLFVLVAVVVAKELSVQERREQFEKRLSKIFELSQDEVQKCIESTRTTEDDIMYATDYSHEDTDILKRVSCLMTCCAQKQGTMVGMKINVQKVVDNFIKHHVPIPPEDLKKFRDSMHACNEEVTESTNQCFAAFELSMCVIRKNINETHPRVF